MAILNGYETLIYVLFSLTEGIRITGYEITSVKVECRFEYRRKVLILAEDDK